MSREFFSGRPLQERDVRRVFYNYVAYFAEIPANSPSEAQITMDNDAPFEAMYGTMTCFANNVFDNQTEGSRIIPSATIEMSTQDTLRLQNTPVPIGSLFGHGASPMVWPATRRFDRRTVLSMKVSNLSNQPLRLWLTLMGCKLYSTASGAL